MSEYKCHVCYTSLGNTKTYESMENFINTVILEILSVQFPTLGFVVERYWQIQAHVPEDFWAIKCFHKAEDGSAEFTWAYVLLFFHLLTASISAASSRST